MNTPSPKTCEVCGKFAVFEDEDMVRCVDHVPAQLDGHPLPDPSAEERAEDLFSEIRAIQGKPCERWEIEVWCKEEISKALRSAEARGAERQRAADIEAVERGLYHEFGDRIAADIALAALRQTRGGEETKEV